MSRARPVGKMWFDKNRNGEKATHDQLELLASYESVEIDDLLDATPTQGEVIVRLRQALGDSPIPVYVLERREQARMDRRAQPACRLCGCEGDSTRHHFVNKWILRELVQYEQLWAERAKNCIPVCIDCHRDLHERDDEDKSIARFLTDAEKAFADEALTALMEERPKLLILIGRGDSYEAQLIKDWIAGEFNQPSQEVEVTQPARLRAVA